MLNHSTTRRNQSTAEQQQTKQSTRNDQRAQPRHMIPLLIGLLLAASCIAAASSSTNINTYQSHHQAQAHFSMISQQQQQLQAGAPVITPFAFNDPVQENQRPSLTCTIVSGDSPVTISWLKDGQLLSQPQAQARKILILKPDLDTSMLKFNSVKLEHAGNYTCVAKNPLGQQSYSAQLIVRAEPRWLREPLLEPIVATRGQTIVIDCQTAGYPKPQQTWKIKNRTQNEFEPLAATGKISLAANGSLVIRNADKADEANYLCISTNGVGKGISWSTPLKVNVPAHFRSNKQSTVVARKHQEIQLRCDAYGDDSITNEWVKNKLRITNDLEPRYSIFNNPSPNGLISVLVIKQTQRQDNAIYECLARNKAGSDRQLIELMIQEEPDNIQELQTTQISSRSVNIVWQEPYDGRSRITEYRFQYRKAAAAETSRRSAVGVVDELSFGGAGGQDDALVYGNPSDDSWQQASILSLPVANGGADSAGNGMRSIKIERLEPTSKYVLRAQAVNAMGRSRFSQPLEFTTDDEAPEFGPSNVRASAINSTSIHVSWDEIGRSKQSGRIHGYYIGYRVANSTAQFIQKPFLINQQQQEQPLDQQLQSAYSHAQVQRLETSINDLRRDTSYEIIVAAFNSRGTGPASQEVPCRTIEMEAPRPVKLSIRRESNESIYIEWHRDALDQNPIDDYVLYQEKNSLSGASQESLSVRLPGNQSHYKAPGLKCGTRYQFYIIAQNKVGKSPASEIVSASTSGNLPVIPGKTSLIKLVNSTCLLVNLNAFQDNGCRIKTFTVRYRVEKTNNLLTTPNGSSLLVNPSNLLPSHAALVAASGSASSSLAAAAASANAAGGGLLGLTSSSSSSSSSSLVGGSPSEWITVRPRSNSKIPQREEDRVEYLCDLDPIGEYTIHVAAANDVGRSEMQYTVQMSSDELQYSLAREMLDMLSGLPNVFAYIPSLIVFLLAGLFLSLVSLILYTTVIKYYQKFIIIHNQLRATRRAKRDEKRRRKLNQLRQQQQKQAVDCWEDQFDEEEGYGDDEDDDDDDDSSAASGNAIHHSSASGGGGGRRREFASSRHVGGHYVSNISNSAFDTSSIDSPCNGGGKYGNGSCGLSTVSNDSSIHARFQCLNSKSYVKMNEYTMLPTISANLSSMSNDIYGTVGGGPAAATVGAATTNDHNNVNNNSLYYSTLRRSNMQTYLPQQRRQSAIATIQQQQQHSPQQQRLHQMHQQQRKSQNMSDIYGYYLAPPAATSSTCNSSPSQQAVDEAANSIFVPPQQQHQPPIIYSAPNIRRQPVFL